MGLRVRLLEEIELELGAHHRREAELRHAFHLRAEHLARGRLHGRAVVPLHVAEHECGRLEPRDAPQRRHVRPHPEVAVALLPARDLVARHRVHLHLEREQVVAALDRVPGLHLVDEELRVEPLAQQTTLHVREGDDHRVDLARRDELLQLLESQHCGDPKPVPSDSAMTLAHATTHR